MLHLNIAAVLLGQSNSWARWFRTHKGRFRGERAHLERAANRSGTHRASGASTVDDKASREVVMFRRFEPGTKRARRAGWAFFGFLLTCLVVMAVVLVDRSSDVQPGSALDQAIRDALQERHHK